MEVVNGPRGAPTLVLRGQAKAAADRIGVARVHVSLTHTDETVAAVVVLES
jgi:holo-[acyl-carrier protein] synthase